MMRLLASPLLVASVLLLASTLLPTSASAAVPRADAFITEAASRHAGSMASEVASSPGLGTSATASAGASDPGRPPALAAAGPLADAPASSGPAAASPTAEPPPHQAGAPQSDPSGAPLERSTAQEWPAGKGTTVVLVEDHRAPLVHVRIDFAAGTWTPWFVKSRAEDAFAIQIYDSAGLLRRRADGLGVAISLDSREISSTVSFSCLRKDLDDTLALLRDLLSNRDFDRRELKRLAQTRSIAWKNSLKDPNFKLIQEAARIAFAKDDARRAQYREPAPPLIDSGKLATARDTLIRIPGRVVGFAGDLTRAEAESLANSLLPPTIDASSLDLKPKLGPIAGPDARPPRATMKMRRLTQIYFGYARDSLRYADPDYPASMIADKVLGGNFYSRLNEALRHQGGETYGAVASSTGGAYPGISWIFTFTRAENAAVAEGKLRAVLETFHAAGITEEERAGAAGNLVGQLALRRQSPDQILGTRLDELRWGLEPDFAGAMTRRAAALSFDEVNLFIRRFYDPAAYTMITVGPE